jgi:hypothetical protein
MRNFSKDKILTHILFWPVEAVSLFMNVWLFTSFMKTNLLTQVFLGIIGAAVDLFQLKSLNKWDQSLEIYREAVAKKERTRSKKQITLPPKDYKNLSYYILFLFVSAGSSLLFNIIGLEKTIENEAAKEKTLTAMAAKITTLELKKEKLKTYINSDYEEARLLKIVNSASTNVGRWRRAMAVKSLTKVREEKEHALQTMQTIDTLIISNAQLIDQVKEESDATDLAFVYLAKIISAVSLGLLGEETWFSRLAFLFLIVVSTEMIKEECKDALRIFNTPPAKKRPRKKRKSSSKPRTKKLVPKKSTNPSPAPAIILTDSRKANGVMRIR